MAGNARFHNKFHRRGHHTDQSAGYPDSGTDPIASQAEPFLGDFYLAGSLSANKNLFIGQDATILGNLSVLGDLSYLDTIVSITSALSVVNVGTGPALTVVQHGAQPIAKFIDKEGTCTLLLDDGGLVGFNTCILEPGIGITINNTISSNQALTANANIGAYHFLIGSVAEGRNTRPTGVMSHAEGDNTIASNNSTHAEGYYTSATGQYGAHAEGALTRASGIASHAEGNSTQATSDACHAEGAATIASSPYSHAEGYYTEAIGQSSHAEGKYTNAEGEASHAEGDSVLARGETSHAEGYYTSATGDFSHAEGRYASATGDYSHAEGIATIANGNGSHAEGNVTRATANYSHAEGQGTRAAAESTHAEGFYTSATNAFAHAEGENTLASQQAAHAEGESTVASGQVSHAQGSRSVASSFAAHAEGEDTVASNQYAHAEGKTTIASGQASHAGGTGTRASGPNSFAHGLNVGASGINSFALGENSVAKNNGDIALGFCANALNAQSLVYSNYCNYYGSCSFADNTFNVFASGGNFFLDPVTVGDPVSAIKFIVAGDGTVGVNTANPSEQLTVNGNISSNSTVMTNVLSAKFIHIVHNPSNDGVSPILRIGETDNGSGNAGFSGAFISYNETTNVFGMSSVFAASAGYPAVSFDRFSNVGIKTDAPNVALTVNGNISANGSLSASGTSNNYFAGNVGINTLVPGEKLTVTGNISASGTLSASGAGYNYFAGNVGINTFAPGEKLTVSGNISANGSVTVPALSTRFIDLVHAPANDGTNPYIRIGETDLSTGNLGFSGVFMSYNESTNVFGISSQFALGAGLPAVAIDRFSRVGIGTDSPARHLNVVKSLGNTEIGIITDASSVASLFFGYPADDTRGQIRYYNASDSMAINVATLEAIRIRGGGQVGIGTTLPAEILTVSGNISANGTLSASGAGYNYFAGNVGIKTNTPGEALTVSGNISASGNLFVNGISSRNIDMLHSPANDGNNAVLRIGEIDFATGNQGFSGAFISYSETTNVFGISSVFGGVNSPAIGIDRFGRLSDVTINGTISSSGGLSAANVSLRSANVITPASVVDNGQFLILNINGTNKAIRLWEYTV